MTPWLRALLPRTIRPRRIVGGPLRGAWLVTSWHDYPAGLTGRTERPLLEWFHAAAGPGQTWLDIGAQYGYTALALARIVGTSGRVFAFEPVSATAGCLDQARLLNGLPQITVVPLGLAAGTTLETRRLPLTKGMADATITPDADGWSASMAFARFDWLWPLIHGGNPAIDGVKIDVQGMELEALEGMREALTRWRPRLVIELHAGVSRARVLDLLGSFGYSAAAVPIEPAPGEGSPLFLDDRSYAFVSA